MPAVRRQPSTRWVSTGRCPGTACSSCRRLTAPTPAGGKVQTGEILSQHVEGADWVFLTVTRYDSWQDVATDRSGATAASGPGSWGDIRRHSAFHRDTFADRIYPN